MAQLNFYDDAEGTAYPFLADRELNMFYELGPGGSQGNSTRLPDDAIVDFGSIVGIDAEYEAANAIYLYRVSREGSTILFEFRSDAAALADYVLQFRRDVTDEAFAVEEVNAIRIYDRSESLSYSLGTVEYPIWRAYLVTGHLANLLAILNDGDALVTDAEGDLEVEPALVQSLYKHYVRGFNLANESRTHYSGPAGCSDSSAAEASTYIVNATNIVGDVKLVEGYNCSIIVNTADNSIMISAEPGAGSGEPCEEVPRYDGEEAPPDSIFLSGGPNCGELISSINGVPGPIVRVEAGTGLQIRLDEVDSSRIIITVDMRELTTCVSSEGG